MSSPYDTIRLPRAGSTQDEARARYEGTPLLVVADRQTGGRGRSGRPWWSADRALFASLAFAPGWPEAELPRLSLTAALAARAALPADVALKWPNDLLDGNGAKVGGVLAEADGSLVTVGLGVNLWWPQPPEGAAGLLASDPGPEAASTVAAEWAAGLLVRAARDAADWGRAEYRAACATLGQQVTWRERDNESGHGVAVDVAADGRLVVQTRHGIRTLVSGEVRSVRAATLDGRRPEVTE